MILVIIEPHWNLKVDISTLDEDEISNNRTTLESKVYSPPILKCGIVVIIEPHWNLKQISIRFSELAKR